MKYLTEEQVYDIVSFNEGEKFDRIKNIIKNNNIGKIIMKIIEGISKKIAEVKQRIFNNDNKINNILNNKVKYPLKVEVYFADINIIKSTNELNNFANQRINEIYSAIDRLMNESNDDKYWKDKIDKEIADGIYQEIDTNLFKDYNNDIVRNMIINNNDYSTSIKKLKTREEVIQFIANLKNKALEYENLMNEINKNISKINEKISQCEKINESMKLYQKNLYFGKIKYPIYNIKDCIVDEIDLLITYCLDDIEDILTKADDKDYDFFDKKPSEVNIPNESCIINIV